MAGAQSRRRLNEAIGSLNRVVWSPRLNGRIAEESGVDLSFGALRVLRVVIDHGPVDLSRLSQLAQLAPNALSRQVKALEAREFVERQAHPDDRRVSVLTATGAGREALHRFLRANDEMVAGRLRDWSDHELDQVSIALERLSADLRRADTSVGAPMSRLSPKEGSP